MSWNPSELTDQFGQKVGRYAASYVSKGEGGGFIAQAQHKLISEKVGGYVTTQVNEIFHIESTGKRKVTDDAKKPSGGFMGGVNQIFNSGGDDGPTENHIPPSERVGQKKEGGGFMGQAKEFATQIFGGEDEGPTEDHIPVGNRVGQPGYQARDAYPTSQNQGGFVGDARNYAGNQPNPTFPSTGGYAGEHIPSGQTANYGNNYGNYGNQQQQQQGVYYGAQQQPGDYYGVQQQQGGYYGGQPQGGYGQPQVGYGQQGPNYP